MELKRKHNICYVDGKYLPESEAKVPIHDRSYLYGDAIFEGIPVRHGVPFKLDWHLERMFKGMSYLCIESPVTRQEMKKIILQVITRNSMVDGYIRPQVSRGVGLSSDKWEPDQLERGPMLVVMPGPPHLREPDGEELKAVRGVVVSVRRIPPCCISSAAKTCNYVNNILGGIERVAAGADVGIMLDVGGNVSEGIIYNVFIVENGILCTPTDKNILPGITRRAVIEIARREGFKVNETDFDVFHLYEAEEVFVTSSGFDILPVGEIDKRKIGDGKPGPITLKLVRELGREMAIEAENFKSE